MKLDQIGSQWDQLGRAVREGKRPPDGVAPELSKLRDLREEAMEKIEQASDDLDVSALIRQYDKVVATASDDLHGSYGVGDAVGVPSERT